MGQGSGKRNQATKLGLKPFPFKEKIEKICVERKVARDKNLIIRVDCLTPHPQRDPEH